MCGKHDFFFDKDAVYDISDVLQYLGEIANELAEANRLRRFKIIRDINKDLDVFDGRTYTDKERVKELMLQIQELEDKA